MLTPQEVSTHAFSKAVMGGYNMAMVDEFLDELTDDYTSLYKENAALKAKLKVLVEKVEDYRATEDSMRATLLTAQKMADSIVKEAEAKRDEMLSQAESAAREKIGQLQQEVEAAQERLRQGQRDLADFIAAAREVCEKELKLLEQLPDLPVEIQAPAEEAQPAGGRAGGGARRPGGGRLSGGGPLCRGPRGRAHPPHRPGGPEIRPQLQRIRRLTRQAAHNEPPVPL